MLNSGTLSDTMSLKPHKTLFGAVLGWIVYLVNSHVETLTARITECDCIK